MIVVHSLGIILSLAVLAGLAYVGLAALAVRRFAGQPVLTSAIRPGVTILKPVCGDDAGLYENLVSFCTQAYDGPVQVVIGAHRESDPAVAVARRVIADLPQADITLVVDGRLAGTNYKICNIMNAMAAAKHDLLVMADSDMRAEPTYLDAVVGALLQPGIGLVTCLYKGRSVAGLPSILGSAFINYGFLPSVLVSRFLGMDTGCFGATMALRRETLQAVGGFESLVHHLADDYVLGEKIRALDLKVAIAPYLIECIVEEPGWRGLLKHELRWQRTIRLLAPAGHAASVVTNPVALGLLTLPIEAFAPQAWLLLAIAVAARLGLLYITQRAFRLEPLAAALLPLRDLLTFALLIASFLGHRVTWRDHSFQVAQTGEMSLEGDSRV